MEANIHINEQYFTSELGKLSCENSNLYPEQTFLSRGILFKHLKTVYKDQHTSKDCTPVKNSLLRTWSSNSVNQRLIQDIHKKDSSIVEISHRFKLQDRAS